MLKASKIFRSILEMLGNLRVIRKSLMKNWESSEVFSLVNSWAVWPLTTIFGVPGVFLAVSRVFRGIMGCSRGLPGLFRAVPGCSGGVPGCSGFYRHPHWTPFTTFFCNQQHFVSRSPAIKDILSVTLHLFNIFGTSCNFPSLRWWIQYFVQRFIVWVPRLMFLTAGRNKKNMTNIQWRSCKTT